MTYGISTHVPAPIEMYDAVHAGSWHARGQK
jgi:hypothetical protein